MSDKLAPLIERQGPWLLQCNSSSEDPEAWAVYVKLNDAGRKKLHTLRPFVEELTTKYDGFYKLTFRTFIKVDFISQGVFGYPTLEEFTEELLSNNSDQLLVPLHLTEKLEELETLRTEVETIELLAEGVYWKAYDHYSNVCYTSSILSWSDI